MLVCDVPMQQPATSCSSKSHIAIKTHTGSKNDQCFSVLSLLTNVLLTMEHYFARQWKILVGLVQGKKRQLMRGWGKHHFLC